MHHLRTLGTIENLMISSKILGNEESPYYSIYSEKLKTNIYVTGQHKIQDPDTGRFIPVSKCKYARLTNMQENILSCLVTDDHLIPIGEYIFWDWEDNLVV